VCGPDTSLGIHTISVDNAIPQLQAAMHQLDTLQATMRFISFGRQMPFVDVGELNKGQVTNPRAPWVSAFLSYHGVV
jgi:hypothetical protein